MTPDLPYTPSIEELAEMYLRLKARVEQLDGQVQQLRAGGTHDTLTRPTYRDLEPIKRDITELQKQLAAKRRK